MIPDRYDLTRDTLHYLSALHASLDGLEHSLFQYAYYSKTEKREAAMELVKKMKEDANQLTVLISGI